MIGRNYLSTLVNKSVYCLYAGKIEVFSDYQNYYIDLFPDILIQIDGETKKRVKLQVYFDDNQNEGDIYSINICNELILSDEANDFDYSKFFLRPSRKIINIEIFGKDLWVNNEKYLSTEIIVFNFDHDQFIILPSYNPFGGVSVTIDKQVLQNHIKAESLFLITRFE